MALHLEIGEEAEKARKSHQLKDAEIGFRRAAEAAREVGDISEWYKWTIWAADCAAMNDDYSRSLSLLIRGRESEPADAPVHEAWLARKRMLDIHLSGLAELRRLNEILRDIRLYAEQHQVSLGDFPFLEGLVLEKRGEWAEALSRFETSWQKYDGSGYLRFGMAHMSTLICLRLGKLDAARDWQRAFMGCGEEEFALKSTRHAQLDLHTALARCEFGVVLAALRRTYADRCFATQTDERLESVRVHLLITRGEDPAHHHHSAAAEFARRGRRAGSSYDWLLLRLDYYLACLRHSAGINPVDDLYYARPQEVPSSIVQSNPAEFNERLRRARRFARTAVYRAKHRDTLLECDWRQREVQSRIDRIEEIARALGVSSDELH